MPYVFTQDVPITFEMYQELKKEFGDEPPAGLIVHVVSNRDNGGLHYIDVWDSRADFERFRDERLHPALGRFFARANFTPPAGEPPMQELDVLEMWAPWRA